MSILSNQLAQFQQKLIRVMNQYNQLQRENAKLKKELVKKDALLNDKEALLKDLNEKLAALRLVNGSFSEEEKKQLGKQIKAYVKEIDRCMALLNAVPKK